MERDHPCFHRERFGFTRLTHTQVYPTGGWFQFFSGEIITTNQPLKVYFDVFWIKLTKICPYSQKYNSIFAPWQQKIPKQIDVSGCKCAKPDNEFVAASPYINQPAGIQRRPLGMRKRRELPLLINHPYVGRYITSDLMKFGDVSCTIDFSLHILQRGGGDSRHSGSPMISTMA